MKPDAHKLRRPPSLASISLVAPLTLLASLTGGCADDGTDPVEVGLPEAVPAASGSMPGLPTTPAHDHAGHGTPADGGVIMAGPRIDMGALPQGWSGESQQLVRNTSQRAELSDVGAFRTSCALSHMSKDDPIVYPGRPGAAHLHAYFGNTRADAYSTAESLRNSGNSTCRGGTVNRSSYWVPALIDKSGVAQKPESAQIYYKTGYNGIAPDAVQVFPEGLRVIAGDARASEPGQEHAYWSCETYAGHPNAVPDCPNGEAVIMVVVFPQCWNGKDLDSPDHKAHMAYPVNGACPASHPVAIPEVSFQVRYDVPRGVRSSEWRLASDMYEPGKPGGYSAHGDWFEGWKREFAEAFVKHCDQARRDCHSSLLGDGREIYSDTLDRQ